MGRFSEQLKGIKKVKNHHAAKSAKVEIRQNILREINSESHVLDAFAGNGAMHDAVWRNAKTYVGCDKEFVNDKRKAFVADNRRVMRCVDLSDFNIFDLDAYGSPWEQALIIAARRSVARDEMIGIWGCIPLTYGIDELSVAA